VRIEPDRADAKFRHDAIHRFERVHAAGVVPARRNDVAAAADGAAPLRQLDEGVLQDIDAILHREEVRDLGIVEDQSH